MQNREQEVWGQTGRGRDGVTVRFSGLLYLDSDEAGKFLVVDTKDKEEEEKER